MMLTTAGTYSRESADRARISNGNPAWFPYMLWSLRANSMRAMSVVSLMRLSRQNPVVSDPVAPRAEFCEGGGESVSGRGRWKSERRHALGAEGALRGRAV